MGAGDDEESRRPLPVSGMLAAFWTLGVGIAVLTTLTLIGWMAAPRGPFGEGLPGVFRTACQLWLAAHHAGFAIPGGRVGLLPIGLMILPGALLYRAGLWMARDADLRVRMPARLPKGTPATSRTPAAAPSSCSSPRRASRWPRRTRCSPG